MAMQEFVTLRKLKNTDALSGMHTARVDAAYEALCSKLDAVSREEVKQLAEMTYQEGILDGILFCRQIVEEIY